MTHYLKLTSALVWTRKLYLAQHSDNYTGKVRAIRALNALGFTRKTLHWMWRDASHTVRLGQYLSQQLTTTIRRDVERKAGEAALIQSI